MSAGTAQTRPFSSNPHRMSDDPQIVAPVEAPPVTEAERPHKPVASYTHTLLVVLLMAAVATMTALASGEGVEQQASLLLRYTQTIVWLWALATIVYLGMRRHGVKLGEVLGRPWKSTDDVMIDVVIAGSFWVVSAGTLALLRLLFFTVPHDTQSLEKAIKAVAPLAPHTREEIALWVAMSITAGLCEEFVFRGYLQRQFAALTRQPALGIALSALVFGMGHAYQGAQQMLLIAIYGAMFGALAHFRRSLKPGMMAHAWQDIFSGLILSLVTQRPLH